MRDPLGLTPQQRREAEERLRAHYEAELARTIELGPDDTTLWPVGAGRVQLFESESGAFVEELNLEGSFPDTLFVLTYRHQLRPGHRFETRWRVWPGDSGTGPEPPCNDVLAVNLAEDIFQEIGHAQPVS